MSIDKEQLARSFSRLSDEALKETATRDLVPEAQALLQAELESRRLEREEALRIAADACTRERRAQGEGAT